LDVLNGIKAGIDMFDCVLPTRNARNGQFLTKYGPINIKNEKYKFDNNPPDPTCLCKVCQNYSRSYIRHLFTVGEYLAGQMITFHNLYFYLEMVRQARKAILAEEFDDYFKEFYNQYTQS
jgi:queuine tRNA-ribosyltransferase